MTGHDYDAIIVGAGPVGGHLGRILSEKGLHVLLLEEHKEIEETIPVCGLGHLSAMNRVGLHDSVLTDVWGARIHSPLGTRVEIGEPSILRTHVVCRKLFDEGCVRQAIEAGATLWVDSKPTDAEVDDEGVTVSIKEKAKI